MSRPPEYIAKDFKIIPGNDDTIDYTCMLCLPAGSFMMGGKEYDDEKPIHQVDVKPFWLGKYPVTQALWKWVMVGENPSHYRGDRRPVENVSWDDIMEKFLPRLNIKELRTGGHFRLPSEAEWEYAARAGQPELTYAGSDQPQPVAWYYGYSHEETKPVGLKLPNAWGLCDLSGNVWEWCADHWHDNYRRAPKDGRAWVEQNGGADRVDRGGGWFNRGGNCRVAIRNGDHRARDGRNGLGFRLAWSPLQK